MHRGAEQIANCLNPEVMGRDLVDIVIIPSGAGETVAVACWMADRFDTLGLKTTLQEVSPGRFNAPGLLRGAGGGATLMLNGHLGTSYTGREEYLPPPPSSRAPSLMGTGPTVPGPTT